jgi:hypothetical protein
MIDLVRRQVMCITFYLVLREPGSLAGAGVIGRLVGW